MNKTFYFQVKRIERLMTVILGRLGIFKYLKWLDDKLSKIMDNSSTK